MKVTATNLLNEIAVKYENWLRKLEVTDAETLELRPYTEVEIQLLSDRLPAYLSDRSQALFLAEQKKANPPQPRPQTISVSHPFSSLLLM